MLKKPSISLLFSLVLVAPLTLYALASWMGKQRASLPVFTSPHQAPARFALTNQLGETVTQQAWDGKLVVAAFFFTHCPLVCPNMTRQLRQVQEAFAGDDRLQLTLFSVDPARDSVARLKAFADRFGLTANWHLLTGNKSLIYQLARKSFAVTATEGDGGEHDFIHSDKLVLLDAHQRIRGYYSGTAEQDTRKLINDIKKLHNEK